MSSCAPSGASSSKRSGTGVRSSARRRISSSSSQWDDFSISAYHEPGTRCPAGHGYLYIDPLGKAYPCAYTKGKTAPVDLLAHDWRDAWDRETPCTRCTVGPMLEFNMLFQRPLATLPDSLRTYG